jgi:hypothetical protein
MLRTFSVVIFTSTVVGVVLKLLTYMLFTYKHFVIYVMFNVLYRKEELAGGRAAGQVGTGEGRPMHGRTGRYGRDSCAMHIHHNQLFT